VQPRPSLRLTGTGRLRWQATLVNLKFKLNFERHGEHEGGGFQCPGAMRQPSSGCADGSARPAAARAAEWPHGPHPPADRRDASTCPDWGKHALQVAPEENPRGRLIVPGDDVPSRQYYL
jgi:hypothetical protein